MADVMLLGNTVAVVVLGDGSTPGSKRVVRLGPTVEVAGSDLYVLPGSGVVQAQPVYGNVPPPPVAPVVAEVPPPPPPPVAPDETLQGL